jgi:virginiamycin B lyase
MFRLRSLWSRGDRPPAPRTRPALEALEDRYLLSTITEFPISNLYSPVQITNGSDGAFWFTAVGNDASRPGVDFIGRMVGNGKFQTFAIPTKHASPLGIATGSDNNIWFTEANSDKIGKLNVFGDATTPPGTITEIPIPSSADPGLMTAGPDGALWFTEPDVNRIARITVTGVITEFPLPTPLSVPNGIIAGANREVWFTEQGSNRIGRIGVDGGTISEVPIPTDNSQPAGLALATDGSVWFAETNANKYARVTASNVITEFTVPVLNGQPTAMTATPDGNLWLVLHAANEILEFSANGVVESLNPVPTANADVQSIVGGPSSVFFTEEGASQIGLIPTSANSNQEFVQSLYINALGRLGSTDELNGWVSVLGASGQQAVASGIERSPEARTHLVKSWYGSYLGRPAVNGEEQPWVNLLLQGNTEESVLSGILGSPEFLKHAGDLFPNGGTPSQQFVQAAYSLLLNRGASASEVSFWVSQLPLLGQSGVIAAIVTSVEFRTDTVIGYYRNLLKRPINPTPQEVSIWVFSTLDITSIRVAIEGSPEYFLKA